MQPWVSDDNVALLTDLYELTMAASYHARGMNAPATFDLFVRRLPGERSFLVACGTSDALNYLEHLTFTKGAIAYLRTLGFFRESFLDYLRSFRFSGEVWACPEGTPVFAEEPILRVTAPLIEAQVVETFLLNCVTFQTMVASKAARVAIACGERTFVDFSPRRDHGTDSAMRVARASYIGGAGATSNVLAGSMYGIPLSGTMAHSYVMSFADESDAFRALARDFPGRATLLIDTYDTLEGARRAARVARELAGEGIQVQAVRLDSGDIADLARGVREILDGAGFPGIRIFASGDLDEYRIAELVGGGAPIDAFGVGTRLGTSADAPSLGSVYKLVEDELGPRMKLSAGKVTLPGRKQVYRLSRDGTDIGDILALDGEAVAGGRSILEQAMTGGRRTGPPEPLEGARERCRDSLARLPARLRLLHDGVEPYRVDYSPGLRRLLELTRQRVGGHAT